MVKVTKKGDGLNFEKLCLKIKLVPYGLVHWILTPLFYVIHDFAGPEIRVRQRTLNDLTPGDTPYLHRETPCSKKMTLLFFDLG